MALVPDSLTGIPQDKKVNTDSFSKLRQEINQRKAEVSLRFAEYHTCLHTKEQSILTQLDELLAELETSSYANTQEMEQLRRAREENMQIVSMNTLSASLDEVISTIDSNIAKLQKRVVLPLGVKVVWREEGPIEFIDNLCYVQKIESVSAPDYEKRKRPFWSGCKRGAGPGEIGTSDVFRYGLGLDVDKNQNIYISDYWNNRIIVLSKEGEYIREIGRDILNRPYSVHVHNESVYVSEWGSDCVTEFDLLGNKRHQVGSTGNAQGMFSRPAGVATDSNHTVYVYVCDRNNNRVQKFNQQLEWQQTVKHQLIEDPSDVKVRSEELFVLATCKSSSSWYSPFKSCNTVFVLTLEEGGLLRAINSQHVSSGRFFCLDHKGNILISDSSKYGSIVILSPEGELVGRLGDEIEEVTMKPFCYQSKGLALNQNVIVNVCDKTINCLQMF